MDSQEEKDEMELIGALDDDFLLSIINHYLPEGKKMSKEDAGVFIPEAKKICLELNNGKRAEPNFIMAKDFFFEGKKDYSRSKRAYSEDDFSEAIYHLHKSTELIMKAFGLVFNNFSRKNLRAINHIIPRVFIKMVQDEKMQWILKTLKKQYPDLQASIVRFLPLLFYR